MNPRIVFITGSRRGIDKTIEKRLLLVRGAYYWVRLQSKGYL